MNYRSFRLASLMLAMWLPLAAAEAKSIDCPCERSWSCCPGWRLCPPATWRCWSFPEDCFVVPPGCNLY